MAKKRQHFPATPARRDLPLAELLGIVERAKAAPLNDADYAALKKAVDTLAFLTQELAAKGTTIDRLRRMLFGASTEKTSQVVGEDAAGGAAPGGSRAGEPAKSKAPGHGRNGAAAYPGAKKVAVPHLSIHRGDTCPCCQKGKIYPQEEPAVLVRVHGVAPLSATVYELGRLRCNLCGEVFTADAPDGVGPEKYDATAGSMIGLFRYVAGLSFNRLETLQNGFGIPLPAATQWDVVQHSAGLLEPAHAELINQAAQGEVLHNDDTTAKILELASKESEATTLDRNGDEGAGDDVAVVLRPAC